MKVTLTGFAGRSTAHAIVAVVLAFAILVVSLLVTGFVGALLWDNWHPVAGIMWLLFGTSLARMGANDVNGRHRRRSSRQMMEATRVLMEETEKIRANGGDSADR